MLKSSLLVGILTEPIDGIDSTLENTLSMVSKYIFCCTEIAYVKNA